MHDVGGLMIMVMPRIIFQDQHVDNDNDDVINDAPAHEVVDESNILLRWSTRQRVQHNYMQCYPPLL